MLKRYCIMEWCRSYCGHYVCMSGLSRGLHGLVRTHPTLNTTSCSHRLAIVWPSGKLLDEKQHLSAAILYGSAAIVCGSATVGRMIFCRNRICVCYLLFIDQIRGNFRTKFKISYSCVHLLSNSGQCDASISKHHLWKWLMKNQKNHLKFIV